MDALDYIVDIEYISGDTSTVDFYTKDIAWATVADAASSPATKFVTLKENGVVIYACRGIAVRTDGEWKWKHNTNEDIHGSYY